MPAGCEDQLTAAVGVVPGAIAHHRHAIDLERGAVVEGHAEGDVADAIAGSVVIRHEDLAAVNVGAVVNPAGGGVEGGVGSAAGLVGAPRIELDRLRNAIVVVGRQGAFVEVVAGVSGDEILGEACDGRNARDRAGHIADTRLDPHGSADLHIGADRARIEGARNQIHARRVDHDIARGHVAGEARPLEAGQSQNAAGGPGDVTETHLIGDRSGVLGDGGIAGKIGLTNLQAVTIGGADVGGGAVGETQSTQRDVAVVHCAVAAGSGRHPNGAAAADVVVEANRCEYLRGKRDACAASQVDAGRAQRIVCAIAGANQRALVDVQAHRRRQR